MKKIKLSDYLANYLLAKKLNIIYSVTGAGSMHFNDSIGNKKGLRVIYTHHEQACSMAAEGSARITGKPAVVNVSTGPGGTNALTGVAGAYVDSIPMLIISGQIMRKDRGHKHGLRQMGVQEINTISVVKPITKYAVTIEDPAMIKYHLDKALYLSTSGKPGPVWIELPLDVQSSFVNPDKLTSYIQPDIKLKKFGGHPVDKNDTLVYNIGNDTSITILELAEKINEICQNKAGVEFIPRRDWDKFPNRAVQNDKAKNDLDFEIQYDVDVGLRLTYDWFKTQNFK